MRGLEDVGGALDKLKKLIDSQGKGIKFLLFSKELKSSAIQVSGDQKVVKRF